MEPQELAKEIVSTLQKAGHTAFYAGGWVRDFLMKNPSSDVDIATSASTKEILSLFPHTVQVGIQFGVVIVLHRGHMFEVCTFREDIEYEDGRKPTRIEVSTPEEDAKRRDFTINGMFYDPVTDTLHDYVGGHEDIKKGIIRAIGEPYERFFEDRLRMIRAVRFACRFGFHIDPETEKAIAAHADTLFPAVSVERIWQELTKMSHYPSFDYALVEMHRLGLLPTIFPSLRGTHLTAIKERVAPFKEFPRETSTLLYLMHLFPDIDAEGVEDLGKRLKTSRKEVQLGHLFLRCKNAAPTTRTEWAKLYADPHAPLCFRVIAGSLPEREKFLAEHQKRMQGLAPYIKRIQERTPVVTSKHLMEEGIKPGKEMGNLLDEAESVSIEKELIDPAKILDHLKKTGIWKRVYDHQ